jgi:hypothetical protein
MSFVIFNEITIVFAAVQFVARRALDHEDTGSRWRAWFPGARGQLTVGVMHKLTLGFSTQQLVTGIALLITAHARSCDISTYHYITALLLATMSSSAHGVTLHVLKEYMEKYSLVAWLRIGGIIIHYVLILMGWIKIKAVLTGQVTDSRLFIRCSYGDSDTRSVVSYPTNILMWAFYLSLIIWIWSMTSCFAVFKVYLPDRVVEWSKAPYFAVFGVYLLPGILVAFTKSVLIFLLVYILRARDKMGPHLDSSENTWGFGQIMQNLLLFVWIFSMLEFYSSLSQHPD